jgi:arylsulfatase A-like enzyme
MTKPLAKPSLPLLLLALFASGCPAAPNERESSPAPPPNIVVIVTDDQRATGWEEVMPGTVRLFEDQGARYLNAFATTPHCCPSRGSIFTGRYAHNHRIRRDMADNPPFDQSTTVQRYLQRAGYRTAMFGKYLNNWDLSKRPPHFDEWAIFSRSTSAGYINGEWNINGNRRRVRTYSTTYLGELAENFVRRSAGEPWALFISTGAPHKPYFAENKYRRADVPPWGDAPTATREGDLSDKPRFLRRFRESRAEARRVRRLQLRTLMSVDDLVAKLYGTLADLGEDANTLSFFLSDNGEMWGEHSLIGKFLPYEAAVRIPLLVRWPERLRGGGAVRRWVATIDIAPTIYDAVGVDPEDFLDGRSLLDRAWSRDALLLEFWRAYNRPGWKSLLTPGFQYTEYYRENGSLKAAEYYDLDADPQRLTNLLGDDDDSNDPELGGVKQRLQRAVRCEGPACP